MVFRNGQSCYNGPQRSLTLPLVCGGNEKVVDVAEPNKCTYSATLYTPAACKPEYLAYADDLGATIPGVDYGTD